MGARGRNLFTYRSDVDYYADEGHAYFSPGATAFGGMKYGKAIVMDYETKNILFEAMIIPPTAAYRKRLPYIQNDYLRASR